MKIGSLDFSGGYIGSQAVSQVRLGSTLLWPLTTARTIDSVVVSALSGSELPIEITSPDAQTGDLVKVVLQGTGQTAPTASQVDALQAGSGATLLDSFSLTWPTGGALSIASGIDEACDIFVVLNSGSGNLSNVGSDTNFNLDTTAAVLSLPTGVQTGETTADFGVTSDTAGDTLYAGVWPTASTPSDADIAAGTGATYHTSAVSTVGVNSFAATGLTSGTAYKAHFIQTDGFVNSSNSIPSAEFTTALGVVSSDEWRVYMNQDNGGAGTALALVELDFLDESDTVLNTGGTPFASNVAFGAAANAFDNSDGTYWASNTETNEHLGYTFTSAVEVNKVRMKPRSGADANQAPYSGMVQANILGTWTDVFPFYSEGWTSLTEQTFANDFSGRGAGRYIRLVMARSFLGDNNNEYGCAEIALNVGGSNVAGTWTATASSFASVGNEADKSNDGNTGTVWRSGTSARFQWLQLDAGVGNSETIEDIDITAVNTPFQEWYPEVFIVQRSDDASTWTNVAWFSDDTAPTTLEERSYIIPLGAAGASVWSDDFSARPLATDLDTETDFTTYVAWGGGARDLRAFDDTGDRIVYCDDASFKHQALIRNDIAAGSVDMYV
ncbi:MAG: discoidin domain-containing protein, partial [Gammaproteobacteria bacterium]|nr:discoidin domain-containing protein [Gammaproteobacteria bacterium]